MGSTIEGKIRNILFSATNGYTVALFRVKKTSSEEMKDFLNKTITITGNFINPNSENTYVLTGKYVEHTRYGFQFQVDSYEVAKPTDTDALIEFLSSKLIKGCGEKTAKNIVDHFGIDAIEIIKENPNRLLEVKGMSEVKANKIYLSICSYKNADDTLIKLKKLGFSVSECSLIFNKYAEASLDIIKEDFYLLLTLIDFNRLDRIFLNNYDPLSEVRIKACILQSFKELNMIKGNTYESLIDVYTYFVSRFDIDIKNEVFDNYINYYVKQKELIKENSDNYYLNGDYLDEDIIANKLASITKNGIKNNYKFSSIRNSIDVDSSIIFNDDQKDAIINALNNSVTIISGGPGVGKTTTVKAIVDAYLSLNKITKIDALNKVALLAPTGRAAKKLASSTKMPAQTIHRFLKWNKESNDFQINEYNQTYQTLVIVDEVSMLDTHLFASLLKGLTSHIKLVLVGDVFQLPSVGPGQILSDLIDSGKIPFIYLSQIYRQSDNSYIPFLARDIKNKDITEDIFERKDDYSFIDVDIKNIKQTIKKICEKSKEKGISEKEIQILAPMYKGENGIDNLNLIMQDFFNPKDERKKEITYGYIVYRENDKVLQQINNPDCNVFNGDIGYITKIETILKPQKKDVITINFEGNVVEYSKEDLSMIKHAYAITIHKSQGSEFTHVIMPVCHSYNKMLYNKLIYTGVSRAKKSLIVLGEKSSYKNAINNDYSSNRKTGLKEKLMNIL